MRYINAKSISFLMNFLNTNPNLKHLSLVEVDVGIRRFEEILKSCSNLSELYLENTCYRFSKELLLLVPCYLKNLIYLELFFDDSGITKNDYEDLLANLPKLKEFRVLAEDLTEFEVSFYYR